MYIVEWYDEDKTRNEMFFDTREAADMEAEKLEEKFGPVAVIWETEV